MGGNKLLSRLVQFVNVNFCLKFLTIKRILIYFAYYGSNALKEDLQNFQDVSQTK